MYDITNILANSNNTQIFYPVSGSNNWQTWQKPPTAKLIEIFCLGGGGGGGAGGDAGGAGSNSAGGAGGAGAGYVKAIFPAYLLPDTLYIRAGTGGRGGITTSGQPGQVSFVSIGPTGSTALYYPILVASSLTVAGGGGGTSTGNNAPNAAAVASGATTTAVAPFLSTAIFTATAGVAGALQNTTGVGVSQTALATSLVTAGANGGSYGLPGTGGSILSASILLTQTVPGTPPTPNSGSALQAPPGYGLLYPFCGTGGAGGGCGSANGGGVSIDSGSNGSNGWYGCGGGGGGCGGINRFATGPKRGRGGNGGDGLVMITVIT